MYRFIETLKIENGIIKNCEYHNRRLNATRKVFYDSNNNINISDYIELSSCHVGGIFKCRLVYSKDIEAITIDEYSKKNINSLKVISADMDYSYKYENRALLDQLFAQRGECDEILIVKNNYLTDTSFSNIVLFDGSKWVTPSTPLLKGSKRQFLLDSGIISKEAIALENLKNFKKIGLVNSLVELGDIEIPIERVSF